MQGIFKDDRRSHGPFPPNPPVFMVWGAGPFSSPAALGNPCGGATPPIPTKAGLPRLAGQKTASRQCRNLIDDTP